MERLKFVEFEFHHQKVANASDELADILLQIQALIYDDTDVLQECFRIAQCERIDGPNDGTFCKHALTEPSHWFMAE